MKLPFGCGTAEAAWYFFTSCSMMLVASAVDIANRSGHRMQPASVAVPRLQGSPAEVTPWTAYFQPVRVTLVLLCRGSESANAGNSAGVFCARALLWLLN